MRDLEVIRQEYLNACAKVGDLSYQKAQAMEILQELDQEYRDAATQMNEIKAAQAPSQAGESNR